MRGEPGECFTVDEMNFLVTAVANLVNTRALCKVSPDPYNRERTKYRVLCSDGKRRRYKQRDVIGMVEKISRLSGFDIGEEARGVLREAGL